MYDAIEPAAGPEAGGHDGSGHDGMGHHPSEGGGFIDSLSEADRDMAASHGWRDTAGILEGYRSLEDRLSGALQVPGEEAGSEEQAAFYADVSSRWTPKDGYRFKMPEALPENFPYDQAFAQEAGDWFKEAGLHPEAAQKLHDRWVGKMAEQFSAHEEAAFDAAQKQGEAAEAAHLSLVREYGEPDSDGYQNAVAKADRALSTLKTAGVDLTGWFAEKGALTTAGSDGLQQVTDPVAVKLLAFIHDSAFSEDGLNGFGAGGEGGNPFETGNPDLRQQSDLLENSPLRARQMIVAAGRDPRLFGL
ncbi:hypothetical protein [uncultured Roseibium sp.]|uniref:hypothetical protein n=1 Tax=uncultured Roseibium sp. TaxID=1936171 RepID=UPI002631D9AA|nr:hypothetical protein [uncultured Roseibium sp.]